MARFVDIPTFTHLPDGTFLEAASRVSYENLTGDDRIPLAVAGKKSWAKLFLEVETFPQLTAWEETIPKYSCDCKRFYLDYKSANKPSENISFEWKWNLKKRICEKLGKQSASMEQAAHIWRANKPIHRVRSVPIVSSVSQKKLDRQTACIQSWLDCGFHVVLMQSKDEIERCKKQFPLPVEWRECDTDRPLIIDMLKVGAVLNSDCELRGDGPDFGDEPMGLLRWNYKDGEAAHEEQWGIDSWHVPKDCIKYLPQDLPFVIGKPFWDYAVPAFLRSKSVPFSINHKPWILHESHPLNWSQYDWHLGFQYVSDRLPGNYGDTSFRESISKYPFNHELGFYADYS